MELITVRSPQDLRRFHSLPRRLHDRKSPWVEPLRWEQAALLDQCRHPFFAKGARARAALFLAIEPKRNQPLGRIAAIVPGPQMGAAVGRPRTGYFGFFESID